MIRKYLLLFFLLNNIQLLAQNPAEFIRKDVVYLNDGSIFRGQIETYEIGKTLKLKLSPDKFVIFEAKNIQKIVQEVTSAEKTNKKNTHAKAYAFREKGIYFASHIGYIGGNNLFGDYTNAFNVHLQGGYQFNRFVGAGIGVGVDFYNVNLGSIIPVYGTFRGYIKKSKVSPYYQVAAGFGIPIENEDSAFTSSKGNYYLAPELGIRIGASAETNLTLGLGLQWQKASYTLGFGDTVSQNVDEYTFRRFNFKIGMLF